MLRGKATPPGYPEQKRILGIISFVACAVGRTLRRHSGNTAFQFLGMLLDARRARLRNVLTVCLLGSANATACVTAAVPSISLVAGSCGHW